ncbi:MAG: hypothetical protein LLG01_01755 [Planctomycetaceae bacterium]|nr:hypothetical protein [Planctomycetaceae bacterium]
MNIVLIGAGSASFGPGMVRDIMICPELKGRGVTLWLVDLNQQALDDVMGFAQELRRRVGADVELKQTTDRCEALPGADYVIISVARRRMELWEQDFRIPLAHGFKHCLGENGGPGAVFHTQRSLHLMMPICRDIERLAPQAMVLNFTNPEMKVLHAILTLTELKAAGLCHGIGGAIDLLGKLLDRPHDSFRVTSAGMNHFYAVLKVEDLKSGQDLLPEANAKVLADGDKWGSPLFRKMLEVFDVFTFPSEDHIGEYLPFGSEFSGVHWHYGMECRKLTLAQSEPGKQWFQMRTDKGDFLDWVYRPSGELAVPIICDIALNRNCFREAVNVLNMRPYIDNLPPTTCIEVPAMVDKAGIHPIAVGPIPEPFAEYVRRQGTIVEILTEAYRTRSKKMLLQALLLDPSVNSSTAAAKMLDEMLKLQAEYLPEYQ